MNLFSKKLKKCKRLLRLPQNSVVFAEFPRSGGTFISSMLLDLAFNVLEDNNISDVNCINQTNLFQFAIDYDQLRSIDNVVLRSCPNYNYFKTHQQLTDYCNYIIIIRNPMKIMRSYYGYLNLYQKNLSLEDSIRKYIKDTPVISNFLAFNNHYINNQRNQKSFFVKNEEILDNPLDICNDLRRHLGKENISNDELEEKKMKYSYQHWLHNEEFWIKRFTNYYKGENMTAKFEWSDKIFLKCLNDSPYFREFVHISNSYGYIL